MGWLIDYGWIVIVYLVICYLNRNIQSMSHLMSADQIDDPDYRHQEQLEALRIHKRAFWKLWGRGKL